MGARKSARLIRGIAVNAAGFMPPQLHTNRRGMPRRFAVFALSLPVIPRVRPFLP